MFKKFLGKFPRTLTFLCLSLVFFSSCKVAFTDRIRNQVEAGGINLSKIQYYNSEKIVLKRTLSSKEVSVASGKVIVQNGEYVEIIKIKKNTPGICDSIQSKQLYIGFENGLKGGLAFAKTSEQGVGNVYQLKPLDCKTVKRSTINVNPKSKNSLPIERVDKEVNVCTVQYNNQTYTTELNVMPTLLIKKSSLNNKSVKKRVAKGRKVS